MPLAERCPLTFKLLWRAISGRGMQPLNVIETIDELDHLGLQIFYLLIGGTTDLFAFERAQETFAISVFPRSGGTAHADHHVRLLQPHHIVVAGVLGAAVGMMHQTSVRLTILDGLVQCRQWQCRL